MVYAGRLTTKCKLCGTGKENAPFYQWISILRDEDGNFPEIGIICQRCAIREAFGTQYKTNKRYIKWREDE